MGGEQSTPIFNKARRTGNQYLQFTFYPDLSLEKLGEPKWVARLELCVKSVPQLMRQGFHWGPGNVREEEGYFLVNREQVQQDIYADQIWEVGRVYIVADLQQPPRWSGRLVVVAREASVLSDFRLQMLSPDRIYASYALNKKERYIYNYSYKNPAWNFNAVYNDEPLEGWWPWPKKQIQEREQEQGGEEGEDSDTSDLNKWDIEWFDV